MNLDMQATPVTFGKRGARAAPATAKTAPTTRPDAAPTVADASPSDLQRFLGGIPLLTFGMIASLMLIFALEQAFAFDVGPGAALSHETLIAFGAASYQLAFGQKEFWRLLLAPLLHASSSHLVGNCVALAMVGFRLEPLIGRGWFALIFVASAIGGIAGSMIGNDPAITTVGASGAITGLVAAGLVMSFHVRADEEDGGKMRRRALFLLVPALLPLFLGVHDHVDYRAHLGGAIVGSAIASALIVTWDGESFRPRWAREAANIALACLGVSLLSCFFIARHYGDEAAVASTVMPDSLAAQPVDSLEDQSGKLMDRYPTDPRTLELRAFFLLKTHQPDKADALLRQAMTANWPARPFAEPQVHAHAQALLAAFLLYQRRPADARDLATRFAPTRRRSRLARP
jgi:rhomboid protease GluP